MADRQGLMDRKGKTKYIDRMFVAMAAGQAHAQPAFSNCNAGWPCLDGGTNHQAVEGDVAASNRYGGRLLQIDTSLSCAPSRASARYERR